MTQEQTQVWVGISEGPAGPLVVGVWRDMEVALREVRESEGPDGEFGPWFVGEVGGWSAWTADAERQIHVREADLR